MDQCLACVWCPRAPVKPKAPGNTHPSLVGMYIVHMPPSNFPAKCLIGQAHCLRCWTAESFIHNSEKSTNCAKVLCLNVVPDSNAQMSCLGFVHRALALGEERERVLGMCVAVCMLLHCLHLRCGQHCSQELEDDAAESSLHTVGMLGLNLP